MSDAMEEDQQQKPPIVIAIRNDAPFPIIQVAPRNHPKDLHKASESCHQVELPKALKYRNAAYYTDVADDFLDNADFEALAGLDTGRPDPSIVLHSNESDVARSIDETINRVIALVLLGGHPDETLTMSSTTQRYNKIDILDPEPYEPSSITCIPDWTAACAYTPEPGKEQILSNLVLEYKDRGLVFTKEFESEMQMTHERLIGAMKEFTERGNQVSNSIATNSGNDQAVASAVTAAQALRQSNPKTLHLPLPEPASAMASQPPSGTGLMSADQADPEPGSGTPPEPNPTSRAKRRRDAEAQPTRPSLTGSQLDATTDAPTSAEGPAASTASAPSGSATGSVLTALAEEARQYEARKDVFLTIARSVDSVVASFDGSRKQIAKEATAYVIQTLKRLINHETSPIAARSWAAVVAPMAGNTTAATRSGQSCQSSARPKATLPAEDQPQAQPKEDLRIFARVPEESLAAARKIAP
ncbi:uncharacterized protein BDZ83DRAFT_750063, partial [Colletotrichum acutatum]